VNTEKQTLTIIRGPVVFVMGSPPEERAGRFPGDLETQHEVRLERSFAIASQKVTLGQFRRFCRERGITPAHPAEYGNDEEGPVVAVSWYQAAEYCNWLSQREGLTPCYLPDERGGYGPGMSIAPDALGRTGYRLPTEEEWEFACRAGAVTSRHYGSAEDLLAQYAWYRRNSDAYTPGGARLKPNDLGLFDILGATWEWCHEPAIPTAETVGLGLGLPASLAVRPPQAMPIGRTTNCFCRGGSDIDLPELVRAAYRCRYPPAGMDGTLGFRIARTLPERL
jgi:formylglycine-generating enzyme required for sulfatase activity